MNEITVDALGEIIVTTNWSSSFTAALGMMFIHYFISPECPPFAIKHTLI
jgi:hypothetical protein